jgi:hypothetical protein
VLSAINYPKVRPHNSKRAEENNEAAGKICHQTLAGLVQKGPNFSKVSFSSLTLLNTGKSYKSITEPFPDIEELLSKAKRALENFYFSGRNLLPDWSTSLSKS